MSESQDVLAANEVFYRAFMEGDFAAMDGLWALKAPVACIHPGWFTLTGRTVVIESWRAILSNPPPVLVSEAQAHEQADQRSGAQAKLLDHRLLISLQSLRGRGVRGLHEESQDEEREDAAQHNKGRMRRIGRGGAAHHAGDTLAQGVPKAQLDLLLRRGRTTSSPVKPRHQRTFKSPNPAIAQTAETIHARTTILLSCHGAAPSVKIPPCRSSPW